MRLARWCRRPPLIGGFFAHPQIDTILYLLAWHLFALVALVIVMLVSAMVYQLPVWGHMIAWLARLSGW